MAQGQGSAGGQRGGTANPKPPSTGWSTDAALCGRAAGRPASVLALLAGWLTCRPPARPPFTPGPPSSGRPTEGDEFNTVWVVDSNRLGFNRAEQWHQFHNGLGELRRAGGRAWVGSSQQWAAGCAGASQCAGRPRAPTDPTDPPCCSSCSSASASTLPGKSFPAAYTRDLKAAMAAAGKIAPTGCPEYGALFTATAQK